MTAVCDMTLTVTTTSPGALMKAVTALDCVVEADWTLGKWRDVPSNQEDQS